MDDSYIKGLEEQNEELKQKLANATVYDDAKVMMKDFVLHYFAQCANSKNDTVGKEFRVERPLVSLLNSHSSRDIVDELWGRTPMPRETFRDNPSQTPDEVIEKFKMYLCEVLDEYRWIMDKEKE